MYNAPTEDIRQTAHQELLQASVASVITNPLSLIMLHFFSFLTRLFSQLSLGLRDCEWVLENSRSSYAQVIY